MEEKVRQREREREKERERERKKFLNFFKRSRTVLPLSQ